MPEQNDQIAGKALILAPTGRDAPVIAQILGSAGVACEICGSVADLVSGLSEACAAVIAEEAFARAADVAAMTDWLQAQPPWSDFPLVLLSVPPDDLNARPAALRDALGNITVLERPLRPDTIVRATRSAARARLRQQDAARMLTELARAEAERRAGEERLRELFDNAADAILIAGPDHKLTGVNPAAATLLGYSREELTGMPLCAIFPWPYGAVPTPLPDAGNATEWRLRGKDGSLVDVEIRGRFLADGRWQAFARDIGDRKRAEAALLRLNETLEARVAERTAELMEAQAALAQAQKMEAVGRLTGGLAHDFNNLLMAISGGLDMLARNPEPERRQRIVDGMHQAVDRAASLTRQLLSFARRQVLEPVTLALGERIGAMEELLARSLRGDIRVQMDFSPDLWPVDADPTQLEVAVLNLAVNARDAMPEGGTLTISAKNALGMEDGELTGDFVHLAVADTGTGMTPEVMARVFEPFFTTKEIGKGSGLGLAQIYGFAQQSGGGVRVESTLGRGTIVSLFLPRSHQIPVPAKAPPATEPKPDGNADGHCPATVLLVEDDDEVASVVSDMIRQLGYRVARVANGTAALGALANGREIDVVFSDILMPGGMDGVTLAREIGRLHPDLPVVLTTGYDGGPLSRAEELNLPLLRKPYPMAALAGILSAALSDHSRSASPAAEASPLAGVPQPAECLS